jgi:hypothetical protein
VSFDGTHVYITYQDLSLSLELSNEIIPDQSTKSTGAKTMEIKVKKAVENSAWLKVEKAGEAKLIATSTALPSGGTQPPSYPTSSKKKLNWD